MKDLFNKINSYNLIKVKEFVFSDGHSTTYFTYTDTIIIQTVPDSTLLYSAIVNTVFHHSLQQLASSLPRIQWPCTRTNVYMDSMSMIH